MTMLLPGMPVTYGMPAAMGMVPMGMTPMNGGFYNPYMYAPTAASSNVLAQALGVAPHVVEPPSVAGSVLKGAGIGALAGAAFGAIPFLPLGLVSGALVGAAAGAIIGLVRGNSARKANTPHTMAAAAHAQQVAAAQANAIARR